MSRNHARIHRSKWETIRRAVFKRDGFRCVMCGRAGRLECDHITPLERNPDQNPYDMDGCQALCRDCHISKTRSENRKPLTAEQQAWRAELERIADTDG